eukprot:13544954-Alexandrium_andersonii.AAC.1
MRHQTGVSLRWSPPESPSMAAAWGPTPSPARGTPSRRGARPPGVRGARAPEVVQPRWRPPGSTPPEAAAGGDRAPSREVPACPWMRSATT